jgi:hypothetical protein
MDSQQQLVATNIQLGVSTVMSFIGAYLSGMSLEMALAYGDITEDPKVNANIRQQLTMLADHLDRLRHTPNAHGPTAEPQQTAPPPMVPGGPGCA